MGEQMVATHCLFEQIVPPAVEMQWSIHVWCVCLCRDKTELPTTLRRMYMVTTGHDYDLVSV